MSESLTEFLLARIAEDEAAAKDATPVGEARTFYSTFGAGSDDWGCHYFNVPPARVLAECEAKRRIAELHGGAYDGECQSPAHLDGPCATLRILALPYANHDDYREEWKP